MYASADVTQPWPYGFWATVQSTEPSPMLVMTVGVRSNPPTENCRPDRLFGPIADEPMRENPSTPSRRSGRLGRPLGGDARRGVHLVSSSWPLFPGETRALFWLYSSMPMPVPLARVSSAKLAGLDVLHEDLAAGAAVYCWASLAQQTLSAASPTNSWPT